MFCWQQNRTQKLIEDNLQMQRRQCNMMDGENDFVMSCIHERMWRFISGFGWMHGRWIYDVLCRSGLNSKVTKSRLNHRDTTCSPAWCIAMLLVQSIRYAMLCYTFTVAVPLNPISAIFSSTRFISSGSTAGLTFLGSVRGQLPHFSWPQ